MTLRTYILIDAHKTELPVILCHGKDCKNLELVATVSQCTKQAEKNYAQLNLETMTTDFSLQSFHSNLLGLPNGTVVIT